MGFCGGSAPVDDADRHIRHRSLQLAGMVESDNKMLSMVKKLLLLGAGESGKSTIFKQARIIHASGYSEGELAQFRSIIHRNVLEGIRVLVEQVNSKNMDVEEQNEELADQALLWEAGTLNPEMADAIAKLWSDQTIQKVYEHRAEFQFGDGVAYFLSDAKRIGALDYVPTTEDALRARVRTSGVVSKDFNIKGVPHTLFDVGGQRSERRKWLPHFDHVTAVIFVAAISEYDQLLAEDQSKNRLHEALDLFGQVVNSKHFEKASVVLFLNKKDLYAEKIKTVDPKQWFPDYTGGCDYDKAEAYFKDAFCKRVDDAYKRDHMTVYTTCATDTQNIEIVFGAMQERLFAELEKNLEGI